MLSCQCDAIGVGFVSSAGIPSGNDNGSDALVPRYLKPSAAEEQAKRS